ncbi:MAG: phosphatidylglycerol lysyltransferase domain-containing protein [Clostridia bacterium]|jgi:hypothetical protein|nr:phosphatidylglycerol lysyltransferase domain-containing protein [Clostridia bacterium]
MIDFKTVELSDKQWMDPLYKIADLPGCQHNFTNIYAWSGIYENQIAQINGYIIVKAGDKEAKRYFYPAGHGDIKPVLDAMLQDAQDCGHEFVLAALSERNRAELDALYPGEFSYEDNPDYYDYVYRLEKLVTLSGQKLQPKRNLINQFKRKYSEWSIEDITEENLDECWVMNKQWCIIHDCKNDAVLLNERYAVQRCLKNFAGLNLEGALLRVNDRVVAFTLGEILNSDTYVTHVEKAFFDFTGAYQMINREFAVIVKARHPQVLYVNREEDMGHDGMRKAKRSYYPERMEVKYIAKLKNS